MEHLDLLFSRLAKQAGVKLQSQSDGTEVLGLRLHNFASLVWQTAEKRCEEKFAEQLKAAQREHELQADVEHWRTVAEDYAMQLHEQSIVFGVGVEAVVAGEADCIEPSEPDVSEQPAVQHTPHYQSQRAKDWLKFAEQVQKEVESKSLEWHNHFINDLNKAIDVCSNDMCYAETVQMYHWLKRQHEKLNPNAVMEFKYCVANHVEHYTVPQYGDAPDDNVETWTASDCRKAIMKYLNRFNTNQRGAEEQKRDILKMAHYMQLNYSKY